VDVGSSRVGKQVPFAELPFAELRVPQRLQIDAERDCLVWDRLSWRYARPRPEMLDQFVELWRGSAPAILSYAKKWGVLYLDRTGRPCNNFIERAPGKQASLRLEPLESWRYFSRRAHSILNIASSLNQGRAGSPTDWAAFDPILERLGGREALKDLDELSFPLGEYALNGCLLASGLTPTRADLEGLKMTLVEYERVYLAAEVNLWLSIARPVLSVGVVNRGWQVEFDYHGCMLAGISFQLAQVLADADNLFICCGCHRLYRRDTRRPNLGQKNYCPRCGSKAAREANRRCREKVAEARRLRTAGHGLREIAERLEVRSTKRSTALETVRRWIGRGE
jgi:hypothetical protein